VKRHCAATAYLRDAVEVYRAEQIDRLDQVALELLARLAGNLDAANAFARLKLADRRKVASFLTTCIQADDLARTFTQRIDRAKETAARMLRLFTAVLELLAFVSELIDQQENQPPLDLLSSKRPEPTANISAMWHGLNLLAAHISTTRTWAREDVLRLGATRKSQIKKAGENAAIGWLAEGVRRLTGLAHFSAVRDLAEVIMEIEIDDLERVRRCARVRKREWRKRSPMVRLVVRPSPESALLRGAIEKAKRRVRSTKTT
jgi:hypothetical protein